MGLTDRRKTAKNLVDSRKIDKKVLWKHIKRRRLEKHLFLETTHYGKDLAV